MIVAILITFLTSKIFFNTVQVMLHQQPQMNSFILTQTEILKKELMKQIATKVLLLVN